eukprot:GHVU01198869.1.p1 GENE.GHVU01198869.1~~GHVU01198869.1.p1  ORF type:complete len:146 (+),score=15.98 GHVU01198869.1:146-583(+)
MGHKEKSAIRSLLSQGENIMRFQWRLIIQKADYDYESVGLVPLVTCCDVIRTHEKHGDTYEAAFVSPMMEYGSVEKLMTKIAGERDIWFNDSLLLNTAKTFIQTMLAFLETNHIFHGNIKPANIFIASDGSRLLLGEFLPAGRDT